MELSDLRTLVTNFDTLAQPERIKLFAWYVHTHQDRARFEKSHIKKCYDDLHLVCPDLSVYFPRLLSAKPKVFLKDKEGHRLEGTIRAAFDQKYGDSPSTIAVSTTLKELLNKIPDLSEQVFYKEALQDYKAQAFRSAIVMTWNLAFHHLESWVLADAARLQAFNSSLSTKYAKKGVTITKIDDFDTKDLKEFEVIEVLSNAKLISGSVKKILNQKLETRNMAAHPSSVVLKEPAATEFILTLVDNVVLKFV
jgi:hypothetical protein